MYNRVILVGNLTRDVEIRYTPSGSAISKVGIATNRRYKSSTGEQKEEVMFIDLTFFGRTAEIANQYLKKGSKVLVEGRLVFEQWTAQDGSKRSRHSVTVENMQMIDSRSDSAATGYGSASSHAGEDIPARSDHQSAENDSSREVDVPEIDIDEEEIPF